MADEYLHVNIVLGRGEQREVLVLGVVVVVGKWRTPHSWRCEVLESLHFNASNTRTTLSDNWFNVEVTGEKLEESLEVLKVRDVYLLWDITVKMATSERCRGEDDWKEKCELPHRRKWS